MSNEKISTGLLSISSIETAIEQGSEFIENIFKNHGNELKGMQISVSELSEAAKHSFKEGLMVGYFNGLQVCLSIIGNVRCAGEMENAEEVKAKVLSHVNFIQQIISDERQSVIEKYIE